MCLHCEASAEAAATPAESAAPESECELSPVSQSIVKHLEIGLRGLNRFCDKGLLAMGGDECKEENSKAAARKRFNDAMHERV